MELGDILESKINRSDYKILIVDDVTSNVLLLKILLTNEIGRASCRERV